MDFDGAEKAHKACAANLSPRFHRLDMLERYVDGTQYDGRKSFWDDSVPVMERAPCIVYPILESAYRSHTSLCIGESRWPAITALSNEDGASFDKRFGLNEADSETIDKLIQAIEDQTRLSSRGRELLMSAQGCGTAVAILGVRRGQLCVDTTKAKWCTPTCDADGNLIELEIKYPYLEEYKDPRTGHWAIRCMLYRRTIDQLEDVTYLPAEAREDGIEPDWDQDPQRSTVHGLGFCPAVWYRFMAKCSSVAEYDGQAPHANLMDEVDALNFALSLRHRGAIYASDPQFAEIGVDEMHNPAPMGRQAEVVIPASFDHTSGYPAPGTPGYVAPAKPKSAARQRGPGIVWRYPDHNSKVELLTLPGDALVPADNNCRDLRAKIAEALAVVFTDTENTLRTVDISGRALREMHKKQTEHDDSVRDDFGANCLLPIVDMLLRICLAKGAGLYLPGIQEALPILQRFKASVEDGSEQWFSPALELDFGEYFPLTGQDKQADITAVNLAYTAGFITRKTAVEEMRDYFMIGSPDEYLVALDKESAEKQAKMIENAKAMQAAAPKQEEDKSKQDKAPPFGKEASPA